MLANNLRRCGDTPLPQHGVGVLITRPAQQAQNLCRIIAAHGGRPWLFPTLSIEPIADPNPAQMLLSQAWDIVIYTSTNAVHFAKSLQSHSTIRLGGMPPPPYPIGIATTTATLIAIGTATAQALAVSYGGELHVIIASPQNSEGILALPATNDITGKRVLIVRGEGGRNLLDEALIARGALLFSAEVYRRVLPKVDVATLLAKWAQDVQVVITTSGESLENLRTLLGPDGQAKLLTTPLITISERLKSMALAAGIRRVICANGAEDQSLLAALFQVATLDANVHKVI